MQLRRYIVCPSCQRPVDEDTEYLDSSDVQKKRHAGIMKLAQRLQDPDDTHRA